MKVLQTTHRQTHGLLEKSF